MIEFAKMPVASRFHGSMVGLAVGSTYPTGLGGELGDEAQLALAIAESLYDRGGSCDAADIRARFEDNAEHWILTDDFGEACSTLGYLAPITISVLPNRWALKNCVALAEATDEHEECIDLVRYFAALLASAQWATEHDRLSAEDLKASLLGADLRLDRWGSEDHRWSNRVARLQSKPWRAGDGDDLGDAQELIDPLEAALWALDTTDSFEEGMKLAASGGEYLTLRCAIYGELAGAIYGYEAIPEQWRSGLAYEERFRGVTESLATILLQNVARARYEELAGPEDED